MNESKPKTESNEKRTCVDLGLRQFAKLPKFNLTKVYCTFTLFFFSFFFFFFFFLGGELLCVKKQKRKGGGGLLNHPRCGASLYAPSQTHANHELQIRDILGLSSETREQESEPSHQFPGDSFSAEDVWACKLQSNFSPTFSTLLNCFS